MPQVATSTWGPVYRVSPPAPPALAAPPAPRLSIAPFSAAEMARLEDQSDKEMNMYAQEDDVMPNQFFISNPTSPHCESRDMLMPMPLQQNAPCMPMQQLPMQR